MVSKEVNVNKDELFRKTIIVNVARGESCDVLVDRSGPWGNPFVIGVDGDRQEVIAKFRNWFPKQKKLVDQLEELLGKRLGCHCAPAACHGDVLKEFLGKKIRGEKIEVD
jgi:hypothetical protein